MHIDFSNFLSMEKLHYSPVMCGENNIKSHNNTSKHSLSFIYVLSHFQLYGLIIINEALLLLSFVKFY